MKRLAETLKKNFKYSLCIVAVMIFTIQIYHIVNEVKTVGDKSNEVETINQNPKEKTSLMFISNNANHQCQLNEEVKCEVGVSVGNIFICVFKCSIAFLFGGMISDRKFIKFGAF